MALHEIRTVDIFEKILHKKHGEKISNLISKLRIIEDLILSIDDICDGESGLDAITRLVDNLSKLIKLDGVVLSILSEKSRFMLEEEIRGRKLAKEVEAAVAPGCILSLLIEGYETKACLAKLYSHIAKNSGFDIDEFEVKNVVAAYFIIDDLKDLEKDKANGCLNFVLSLLKNKNLDSDSKKLLLEITFLHFLENIYDNDFIQELIKQYREEEITFPDFEKTGYEKIQLQI